MSCDDWRFFYLRNHKGPNAGADGCEVRRHYLFCVGYLGSEPDLANKLSERRMTYQIYSFLVKRSNNDAKMQNSLIPSALLGGNCDF